MGKRLLLSLITSIVLATLLVACATPTPVATTAPEPTTPPVPTASPVPPPAPGTADNPIIMGLAPSATTQELQTGGEAIAAKLSELTGYSIKVTVPASYGALVEAMGSGNAQIGWLPPFTYILAHEAGYADVGLATIRFGADHYSAQFIANAAGGYTSYYDAATGKNTADAKTALAQFANKKPCWTDPLSSSGYVIPLGLLKDAGISIKAGAWVQGHPTVVKSVYLSPKGEICDFGATFAPTPDVTRDFPDVNEKVLVVWMTDPVIPNDNVSFAPDMPADMRAKIVEALLSLAGSDEGKALLKNGGYDIQGLKVVDDTFYDAFRVYLQASGVDTTTLMGK